MKIPLYVLLMAAIIGVVVAWKVYAFKDCRMVGHSKFYCIMQIGSK